MAHWVRSFTALAEDQGLVLSTYMVAHDRLKVQGTWHTLCLPWVLHACAAHTYIKSKHPNTEGLERKRGQHSGALAALKEGPIRSITEDNGFRD